MFTDVHQVVNGDVFTASKDGKAWELPVYAHEDLKRFKKLTCNGEKDVTKRNWLVMGRGTYEDKVRKLTGRNMLVITSTLSDLKASDDSVHVAIQMKELLKWLLWYKRTQKGELFVIGGPKLIFDLYDMDLISKSIITYIDFNVSAYSHTETIYFEGNLEPIAIEPFKTTYHSKYGQGDNPDILSCITTTAIRAGPIDSVLTKLIYLDRKEPSRASDVFRLSNIKFEYNSDVLAHNWQKHMMLMDHKDNIVPLDVTGNRKLPIKSIAAELFWILSGSIDAQEAAKNGCKVWLKDTCRKSLDERGFKDRKEYSMGPAYGFQMRHYGAEYKEHEDDYKGFDQLRMLFEECERLRRELDADPDKAPMVKRRTEITLWNPKDTDNMTLPPCLNTFVFVFRYSKEHKTMIVDMTALQRSMDYVIAGNWNRVYLILWQLFVCKTFGFRVGKITHVASDCHLYANQKKVAKELLVIPNVVYKPLLYMDDDFCKQCKTADEALAKVEKFHKEGPGQHLMLLCRNPPKTPKIPFNTSNSNA